MWSGRRQRLRRPRKRCVSINPISIFREGRVSIFREGRVSIFRAGSDVNMNAYWFTHGLTRAGGGRGCGGGTRGMSSPGLNRCMYLYIQKYKYIDVIYIYMYVERGRANPIATYLNLDVYEQALVSL